MAQVLIFNFSEFAEFNKLNFYLFCKSLLRTLILFKSHHLGWQKSETFSTAALHITVVIHKIIAKWRKKLWLPKNYAKHEEISWC